MIRGSFLPSNAASRTSPVSTVGHMISALFLKTSSPSYPRALFLLLLFLPFADAGSASICVCDCVVKSTVNDGRTARAKREERVMSCK